MSVDGSAPDLETAMLRAADELVGLRAKLAEVRALVAEWNGTARQCAHDALHAVTELDQPAIERLEAASSNVGRASTYELCAAQLAGVLARPPRPNASDHEDEGE